MIENEVVNLISTVGFPIAMCVYLVTRFEKKISENTKVMIALNEYIRGKNNE